MGVPGRWTSAFLVAIGLAAAATPTTVEVNQGNLHLTASVARTRYAIGEVVDVTVTTQNVGTTPLTVTSAIAQSFDVVVRRPRGDEVWRWSHNKAFTQALQSRTLEPSQAVVGHVAWDQRDLQGRRVDPGTYEVVVMFLGRIEGMEKRFIALPPIVITIQP